MQNRRQFLEESMIVAASVLSAPSAARSAPNAISSETAITSPNEIVRHAIIGCRIRGKVHAAEFAKLNGVEVAYVCDPDLQLAEALAESVEKATGRKPKVVQDLRLINDDKSIDTLSVAAPNHWHALATIWGMQAGKHVYVEKPLCHNVVEGRRMIEVADKTKRICQVGTQNRSRGDLAAAAQYIRDGKLGEISHARTIVYGARGSIGPRDKYELPTGIDYSLWLGPAEMRPISRKQLHYDWHWDWNTGNGELGNNNIHYVDMCRLLLGLKGLGDSVIGIGGRLGYEDAGDTPNTQLVAHRFGEVTLVQEVRGLKSDPFSDKFKGGCIVYGSEGFIAESTVFDPEGNLVKKLEGNSLNHFENFMGAVRSGRREDLKADVTEGHQSTGLCHVGNISTRLGRPESIAEIRNRLAELKLHDDVLKTLERMTEHLKSNGLDLEKNKLNLGPFLSLSQTKEEFVGNAEANKLLSREYRAPFVVPAANAI